MSVRAIAREVGVSHPTVGRVLGPRDAVPRVGREGQVHCRGTLQPLPDPVETLRVIDDTELWQLLSRWLALANHPIRKREADALFAGRLYQPITSLISATAARMPTRAFISFEQRSACAVHIVALLMEKFRPEKIRPTRCGSFITFQAHRYLIDCNTGGKANRQASVTSAAMQRVHAEEMPDGPDMVKRVEARMRELGASKVKSIKPHKKKEGVQVVRFTVYWRPFASWKDGDDQPIDPRSYGIGWDPWDRRLVCRGVVRGFLAEVLDAVGDIDLTGREKNSREHVRQIWGEYRRARNLPDQVDDDTWAEVVDAMSQLATMD